MDVPRPPRPFPLKDHHFWIGWWGAFLFLSYFQAHGMGPGDGVDDSFLYVSSLRSEGALSLGVHHFVTYGPLFPWLGLALPGQTVFHFGAFLIQAFFFATLLRAIHRMILPSQGHPVWSRWILFPLISLLLLSVDLSRHDENIYQFWTIAQATIFFIDNDPRRRKVTSLLWCLGASCLLLFKGSVGIGCSIAWLLGSLSEDPSVIPFRERFARTIIFAAAFLALFRITAHAWNPLPYLQSLLAISANYSESHVIPPPKESFYLAGLLFGLATFLSAWSVATSIGNRRRKAFFLLTTGLWIFLNFKHGFVRADIHMSFYYSALLPIIGFWVAGTPFPSRRAYLSSWAGLLAALMLFSSHLAANQGQHIHEFLLARAKASRIHPSGTVFLRKAPSAPLPQDARIEEKKRHLLSLVRRHAEDFGRERKPTLALLANDLLLGRCLSGHKIEYLPSVLLYLAANTPWLQKENRRFLERRDRPDFLLLQLTSIDDRNPNLDFSHLLPSLLAHYHYLGCVDGYIFFKRQPEGTPPSEVLFPLLRIVSCHPGLGLSHGALKVLLKTPKLQLRVSYYRNHRPPLQVCVFRAMFGDLQRGVFFFPPYSLVLNGSDADTIQISDIQTAWVGWGSTLLRSFPAPPFSLQYADPRETDPF